MIPQIIVICLWAIILGLDIERHGKDRTRKEDAWSTLIAIIIMWFILYWGGFWDVFFK